MQTGLVYSSAQSLSPHQRETRSHFWGSPAHLQEQEEKWLHINTDVKYVVQWIRIFRSFCCDLVVDSVASLTSSAAEDLHTQEEGVSELYRDDP